jgi:hypothetical protein
MSITLQPWVRRNRLLCEERHVTYALREQRACLRYLFSTDHYHDVGIGRSNGVTMRALPPSLLDHQLHDESLAERRAAQPWWAIQRSQISAAPGS